MSAIPLRGRRAALRGPAALAAAAALLVTASCADPDHRTEGQPAGRTGVQDEVVVAVAAEPDTFNPVLGYARWGDGKVVEGLLGLDADLEPQPLLAEDLPEVSDDGLTYTYTLREGVTFADGSALDAQDVVATYGAALDPGLGSPVAADLTALAQVEAVDRRTVRFHLRTPQSSFVVATVLGIVPSETLGGDLSAAELDRVAEVLARHRVFDVVLDGIGVFPDGIVHLRVHPEGPLRALTAALADAFPEHPPYGGRFGDDVVPHLTLDALGPGVVVEPGAEVVDSVLFEDVTVGKGAFVGTAIVDHRVEFAAGSRLGVETGGRLPVDEDISPVGRESSLARGVEVERGARLEPGTTA